MKDAVTSSVKQVLVIQGDGDYDAAATLIRDDGFMADHLTADLERVNEANIPIDIVFVQGKDVLGL